MCYDGVNLMDTTDKDSQLLEQTVDAIKCRQGLAYTLIDVWECGSRSLELGDKVVMMTKVGFRVSQLYPGADLLWKDVCR